MTRSGDLLTFPLAILPLAILPLAILPLAILPLWLVGCGTPSYPGPAAPIRYAGSSTISHIIRDVQAMFPAAEFTFDTSGESAGGEQAILTGTTDLAGVANRPQTQTLPKGIRSAVIGRDAIAVIAHLGVGVDSLSLATLRRIFAGELTNWKSVTGVDARIRPMIVAASSATRGVFRDAVLGGAAYGECEVVIPDRAIIERVASTPGAIGHISFSFLEKSSGVRALTVGGEAPTVTNFSYPIARPLYLMWRTGNPEVQRLVDWILSPPGQRVVMRRFVGTRVVAVTPEESGARLGHLTVITETYPVYDGGIYYYPHRPYDVLTRRGELVRHVRNHQGDNDERPTRLALPPGTYLVRPYSSRGPTQEFFVTVTAGQTTEVQAPER